ncbi:MAG: ankyrin repeat domain-containing protein [Planctomycetota bacterium]
MKERFQGGGAEAPDDGAGRGAGPPPVHWLEADDPSNPFGFRVLNLMPVTQTMVAVSGDPTCAARAVAWRGSTGAELDEGAAASWAPVAGELRYPIASELPDGLLATPQAMEQKWVLALRRGRLLAARSWTAQVVAAGAALREEGALVVRELRLSPDARLEAVGDPLEVFDWLVRTLALGQRLPLPASATGLALLQGSPLVAFSLFGDQVLCAADRWEPPRPTQALRADGALLVAVRAGDSARARALVAAGEPVDAPGTVLGYTALCAALVRGDEAMIRTLLELGADPRRRVDRGMFPLGVGIVHGASPSLLAALVEAGADLEAQNDDGYGALHAAAEVGRADAIEWLLDRLPERGRHELERPTGRGHTALQLAAALGRVEAARALLARGADPRADSPDGDSLAIARREGQAEVVALLERRWG